MAVSFTYVLPSGTNPFIPSPNAEGSGQLLVDYSRNEKDFLVNRLTTITPVNLPAGYWQRFNPADANRLRDLNTYKWRDGQQFPAGDQAKQGFTNLSYATERYAEVYPIGYQEKENATWDVETQATNILGPKLMMIRTKAFVDLVTAAGNYLSTNTKTATSWGGGTWAAATATNRYIQKTLNAIERQVNILTLGTVTRKDLILLLSPTVALGISETAELQQYVVNNQFALGQLKGGVPGQNAAFGLPDQLYGYKVEVMSETYNSANRGAADSVNFFAPENGALVLARPGGLENTGGFATAFGSVHMFSYQPEEMKMETHDEPHNRRLMVQAYDNFDMKIVSPETLFQITSILS